MTPNTQANTLANSPHITDHLRKRKARGLYRLAKNQLEDKKSDKFVQEDEELQRFKICEHNFFKPNIVRHASAAEFRENGSRKLYPAIKFRDED